MIRIGDININNILMAPMAGISNAAYFKICEEFGLSYAVTELISSEAVIRNSKKTFDMLKGIESLSIPFGIQIFGSNPVAMGKAAKILEDKFHPSIIDINMGCPVPKVAIKNHAGSALMKNPDLVKEIVTSVVSSVTCPVSVKIRSGWDKNSINAPLIAKICEESGACMICVHGRTRSQGYSGNADWDVIKSVKEAISIPVIGNGDIKTIYDPKKMMDYTGCDAVMIGRAMLGNPWFIKRCSKYTNDGIVMPEPSVKDRVLMIKKHYSYLKEFYGEKHALLEIRSHAIWYLKGISGVKEYKNKIMKCVSEIDLFNILNNILLDKEVQK